MQDQLIHKISDHLRHDSAILKTIEMLESKQSFSLSAPDGASILLYLHQLLQTNKTFIVVAPTDTEAEQLSQELSLLSDAVLFLPWWGLLTYRGIEPSNVTAGLRSYALNQLISHREKYRIVVCSYYSFLNYLPSPNYTLDNMLSLRVGQDFYSDNIVAQLTQMGYIRSSRVSLHGEFAQRGEVIDIFPIGEQNAIRLFFEFDELEKIRYFEPSSQASLNEVDHYDLAPCHEMLWNEERLAKVFSQYPSLQQEFLASGENSLECSFLSLFASLAEDKPSTLFDYLGDDAVVFMNDIESLKSLMENAMNELNTLKKDLGDANLKIPRVEEVFAPSELFYDKRQSISLQFFRDETTDIVLEWQAPINYMGNISFFKEQLADISADNQCYVITNSEAQKERLNYLLKDTNTEVYLTSLSSGIFLTEAKACIIHENEIFGRKKNAPASLSKTRTEVIDSFVDLVPDDYIVHINYGIGQFKGIKRMKIRGHEKDYIQIMFAKEDSIFLPIEQMNLVQRYIGREGAGNNLKVKLDTLGGTSWQKRKQKTSKSVEELADWLIGVYSKRQAMQGYAFSGDNPFQIEFEASFPYTETADQLQATAEIKADMESIIPMDRLLCGDVGFGKTEVAMRASFKAVVDSKQVAIMCPTTILCEQHYINFQKRFARFPVKIGMVSRFVSLADQRKVINELQEGKIDILIGTHKVLNKEIKFNNLGLLIIDEEQRFGVKHKEKLKEIKSNIDCLTLSATPIPRTLHMSLTDLRDMSLLKTPPQNRQPVETMIQEFNPQIIADAIMRECDRGGQVFYLHNRVESLEEVKLFLQELLPKISVEMAHGGMKSNELEDIMHRFISGSFHVLLATTIIENGIDISNANTIIIDRADRYGISQLYQLRGRVGRSELQGYAYLFYPSKTALTEIARKRLRVIEDHTELGSGFKVAMRDLEVRGGGNLLGAQQSGEIASVGFELYLQMLADAIKQRKTTQDDSEQDVYLELEYSAYIPDTYINDISEKMDVYKKFSRTKTTEQLITLQNELHDRFGPAPLDIQRLANLAEIRISCFTLHIISLKEQRNLVELIFSHENFIPHQKIIALIQQNPQSIKLDPANKTKILIVLDDDNLDKKMEYLKMWLKRLE